MLTTLLQLVLGGLQCPDVSGRDAASVQRARPQAAAHRDQPELRQLLQAAGGRDLHQGHGLLPHTGQHEPPHQCLSKIG